MASALFGSTAIGYGDLFDRKVDDNQYLSDVAISDMEIYSVKPCNIRRGFSRVGYYLGETE